MRNRSRRCWIAYGVSLTFFAATSTADEKAIDLPDPPGAVGVQHITLKDTSALETLFTLKANYPASPAWDHYSKVVHEPWVPCVGSDAGAWQSFLDGTKNPVVSVHQQMHTWIDTAGRRSLTLAIRYTSHRDMDLWPDNDEQNVYLVEYRDIDTEEWKTLLKLTCGDRAPSKVK